MIVAAAASVITVVNVDVHIAVYIYVVIDIYISVDICVPVHVDVLVNASIANRHATLVGITANTRIGGTEDQTNR